MKNMDRSIYNLLSAVFIGSDWHIKTCQWYQNALYSIYKKGNQRVRGVEGGGRGAGGVCYYIGGTLDWVISRPLTARPWRCPCLTLCTNCSHWYQEIEKYITTTHRCNAGYSVVVGLKTAAKQLKETVYPLNRWPRVFIRNKLNSVLCDIDVSVCRFYGLYFF